MAREAPYTRLKRIAMEWASKVRYPHKKLMWRYEISAHSDSWRLSDLKERAAAAQQLGYHIELKADGKNLEVFYVKDAPDLPFELSY